MNAKPATPRKRKDLKLLTQKVSPLSQKLSPPHLFKSFAGGKDIDKARTVEEDAKRVLKHFALQEMNKTKRKKERSYVPEILFNQDISRSPFPEFVSDNPERLRRRIKRYSSDYDWSLQKFRASRRLKPVTIGKVVNIPSPNVSTDDLSVVPRRPSIAVLTHPPEAIENYLKK